MTFAEARERVSHHLAGRAPVTVDGPGLRRAAVSVILYASGSATSYVLIRRAARGRNAGQWALPGGKLEPGETALQAALREAEEEVALPAAEAELLGVLDDFPTRTGFAITPHVVAAPEGWQPTIASPEVASVHEFSLDRLRGPLDDATDDDVVRWVDQEDGTRLLQLYIAEDRRVHAPTGAMLLQLREVGLRGRELSVADLVQPTFTHR